MAIPTKDSLFKPSKDSKAQSTTSVARSISDAETEAREAKTARLRKLRLQKEADEAAAEAAAPFGEPSR